MKKLFLGAAIAASSIAFGQQFGVKAGVNISSVSKDTWEDSKSKVGFNAGVFMNAPLAENFSIQPEVLYSQYGAKTTTKLLNQTYSSTMSLDYITVPVMFQYNATPEFYLEAGPEFGFLVSAKNKFENESTGNSNTSKDFKDSLNTFNFGVGIGLGYNITPEFGINARYIAGLNDFTDNDKWVKVDGTKDEANNKNGAFQIGLTYKFAK